MVHPRFSSGSVVVHASIAPLRQAVASQLAADLQRDVERFTMDIAKAVRGDQQPFKGF